MESVYNLIASFTSLVKSLVFVYICCLVFQWIDALYKITIYEDSGPFKKKSLRNDGIPESALIFKQERRYLDTVSLRNTIVQSQVIEKRTKIVSRTFWNQEYFRSKINSKETFNKESCKSTCPKQLIKDLLPHAEIIPNIINSKVLRIAVDATPRIIGGYCVNEKQNLVHFYTVSSNAMPWVLRNKSVIGDPGEFEMKNLLCALLLWEELILAYKSVKVYTDNSTILGQSIYGERVRNFICHLQNCKRVKVANQLFVSSKEDQNRFQKYIIPADHLSRNRVKKFVKSIETSFGPYFYGDYCIEEEEFDLQSKAVIWARNSCTSCGFALRNSGSFTCESLFN